MVGISSAGVCLLGSFESAIGIRPGDCTRGLGVDKRPSEGRFPKNVGDSGLKGILVGVVAPEDRL